MAETVEMAETAEISRKDCEDGWGRDHTHRKVIDNLWNNVSL